MLTSLFYQHCHSPVLANVNLSFLPTFIPSVLVNVNQSFLPALSFPSVLVNINQSFLPTLSFPKVLVNVNLSFLPLGIVQTMSTVGYSPRILLKVQLKLLQSPSCHIKSCPMDRFHSSVKVSYLFVTPNVL